MLGNWIIQFENGEYLRRRGHYYNQTTTYLPSARRYQRKLARQIVQQIPGTRAIQILKGTVYPK